MSEYSDGECSSVHDAEWRTARKTHKCDACEIPISPGHRYHRTFYVFDGSPGVDIRCERCQAIYSHLSSRMTDSEEFCNARLNCGHTYEERWREPPPEWLAALAFWLPGDPLPPLDVVRKYMPDNGEPLI